jgi:hypothetical protein
MAEEYMFWSAFLGRAFTDNLVKSIAIGLLAIIVSFAPFLWAFLRLYFDSAPHPMPNDELWPAPGSVDTRLS